MGLRNQLQDLLDIQALSGQFAQSAQGLRQQAGQQALAQQAPGLIQQGNIPQVLSLAAAAGDTDLLRQYLVNSQKKEQSTKAPLLTEQDFLNAGEDPKIAKIAGSFTDKDRQEAFMKTRGSVAESKRKEEEAQSRTDIRAAQKQNMIDNKVQKIGTLLTNVTNKIDDSTAGLYGTMAAFKEKPTIQSSQLAIRSVLKAIGEDRISDNDVQGINFTSLGGNWAQAKAFLTGKTSEESLSVDQQQELLRIGEAAFNAAQERRKKEVGNIMRSQLAALPALVEEDHPIVSELSAQSGLMATYDPKTKKVSFGDTKKTTAPLTPESNPQDIVKSLPEGKQKQQFQEALNTATQTGKTIGSKFMNALLEYARSVHKND